MIVVPIIRYVDEHHVIELLDEIELPTPMDDGLDQYSITILEQQLGAQSKISLSSFKGTKTMMAPVQ
jgi:hypothetical protein